MDLSERTVKEYIERLNAASEKAAEDSDFERTAQLSEASAALSRWLKEGMSGPMPVDVGALLGEESPSVELTPAEPPRMPPLPGEERLPSERLSPISRQPVPEEGEAPSSPETPSAAGVAPELPPDAVVIRGRRASYHLVKLLGGGRYGEVWKARVIGGELWQEVLLAEPGAASQRFEKVADVALKKMLPGLDDDGKSSFRSEVIRLRELQGCEKGMGLRVDGYSLFPTMFESLGEGEAFPHPAFFVQTLALGRPVDELMAEEGALAEVDALTIIAQFCRVLQVLHEGLKRSYLDFQPRNIFWDEKTRRIMVIDWNLLSNEGNVQVGSDLLAASRLLYRLLMGRPAPEPGPRRALAQPPEAWGRLSIGAQEILARALHINPSRRFLTAADMRRELEHLLDLWKQPPEWLVDRARAAITPGDTHAAPDPEQCRQAAVFLSIAQKKGPSSAEVQSALDDVRAQVEAHLAGRGYLVAGRRHFESMGYEQALQNLLQAQEEARDTRSALEAARWIQVVRAAQGMARKYGRLDREKAVQGLEYLQEEKYKEAVDILEKLSNSPGAEPLQDLVCEGRGWLALQESESLRRSRRLRDAAKKIREAQSLFAELSYANLVGELTGDLAEWHRSLEEQAAKYEKSVGLVSDMESAFGVSLKDGLEKLRIAFESSLPYPPNELVELAVKQCEEYIARGDFPAARAVAVLGLDYVPGHPTLWGLWRLAATLDEAKQVWEKGNRAAFQHAVETLAAIEEWRKRRTELVRTWLAGIKGPEGYFQARFYLDLLPAEDPSRIVYKERLEELWSQVARDIDEAFSRGDDAGIDLLGEYFGLYPFDRGLLALARDKIKLLWEELKYPLAGRIAALSPRLADLKKQTEALQEVQTAWRQEGWAGLHRADEQLVQSYGPSPYRSALLKSCFREAEDSGDYLVAKRVLSLFLEESLPPEERSSFQSRLEKLRQDWGQSLRNDFRSSPEQEMEQLRALWQKYPGDEDVVALADERIRSYLNDVFDYPRAGEIARLVGRSNLADLSVELQEAQRFWEQGNWTSWQEAIGRACQCERRFTDGASLGQRYVLPTLRARFDGAKGYYLASKVLETMRPLLDEDGRKSCEQRLESIGLTEEMGEFRRVRVAAVVKLREVVSLDLPELPSRQETAQGPMRYMPERLRRNILKGMQVACDELLERFPEDEDAPTWRAWRQEIRRAMAPLPAERPGLLGRLRRWVKRWKAARFARPKPAPAAEPVRPRPRWQVWRRWGIVVAFLAVLVGGIFAYGWFFTDLPSWLSGLFPPPPAATPTAVIPTTFPTSPIAVTPTATAVPTTQPPTPGVPVGEVKIGWNPTQPAVGQPVTFMASASGTLPITYTWNFGDGDRAIGNKAEHTYAKADVYTVTLTATNLITATASAVATVTVVQPPLPVYLAFPKPGEGYAVFPWQILITATEPATLSLWLEALPPPTAKITVTLFGKQKPFSGTLLLTETWPLRPEVDGGAYVLRWTRGVDDLRELPDGEYRLRVEGAGAMERPVSAALTFRIDSTKAVKALYTDEIEICKSRPLPYQGPAGYGSKIPCGTEVRVLGRLQYVNGLGLPAKINREGYLDVWCYFEYPADDGRRGWTWCQFLSGDVGQVPFLAPSIPERLYSTGGR